MPRVTSISETSRQIKPVDMVFILMSTEAGMKENGSMTSNKVKAKKLGPMAQNMLEIIKME